MRVDQKYIREQKWTYLGKFNIPNIMLVALKV